MPLQTFMVLAKWPTSSYMAWSEEVLEKEWGVLNVKGKPRVLRKACLGKKEKGGKGKKLLEKQADLQFLHTHKLWHYSMEKYSISLKD